MKRLTFGNLTVLPNAPFDTDLGDFALTRFWIAAQRLNPLMPQDWDSFLEMLRRAYFPKDAGEAPQGYTKLVYYPNSSDKQLGIFMEGLGVGLRSVGFDQEPAKIQSAMESLAAQGAGALPAEPGNFFGVIQNAASQIHFLDAASFVARESASQIAQGVQNVGEAVLDTGSALLEYKNYLLIGAAGLAVTLLYLRFVPQNRSRR